MKDTKSARYWCVFSGCIVPKQRIINQTLLYPSLQIPAVDAPIPQRPKPPIVVAFVDLRVACRGCNESCPHNLKGFFFLLTPEVQRVLKTVLRKVGDSSI